MLMRGLPLWEVGSPRSWLKKVLESPNMDYEVNFTKQPNHINMGYNSAKLHSNKGWMGTKTLMGLFTLMGGLTVHQYHIPITAHNYGQGGLFTRILLCLVHLVYSSMNKSHLSRQI